MAVSSHPPLSPGLLSSSVPASFLPEDQDVLYEESLLRNPYSLRTWWRYLESRSGSSPERRAVLFERAVRALPGSYKLWMAYLRERVAGVRGYPPGHARRVSVWNAFERALVSMHKMPAIWSLYLSLLREEGDVTRTRRAHDRALAALPVSQHARWVWPGYLSFVTSPGVPVETTWRVYARYLRLEPGHAEECVAFLKRAGRPGQAAAVLARALNDPSFVSLEGASRHELWLELCELVSRNPETKRQHGLDAEALLRSAVRRSPRGSGRLWAALADYHVRAGRFERARDVYGEALDAVVTVRDFGLVYDALTQFEESLIAAQLEGREDEEEADRAEEEVGKGAEGEALPGASPPSPSSSLRFDPYDESRPVPGESFAMSRAAEDDVDLRLARLERLVERRPLLLSAVVLRQNPHAVGEWLKRAELFAARGDEAARARTLAEAIATVDPARVGSTGRPTQLWLALAGLYEHAGDAAGARAVFERATREARVAYADDAATLWAEWAEFELRGGRVARAREVVERATAAPADGRSREEEAALPPRLRCYRSPKLWALRADLAESVSDLDAMRDAFERAGDLGALTVAGLLDYAQALRERGLFEESCRAYERGCAKHAGLFKPPHSVAIWKAYLAAFVDRHGADRLDRARALHRAALEALPAPLRKDVYLSLAALEKKHGLARAALDALDAARDDVPRDQRLAIVDAQLPLAAELFGLARVRDVYEAAIEAQPPKELPDDDVILLCKQYAQLEAAHGEPDRARGVFVHGARLADPHAHPDYWQAWSDFEVRCGDEESFREMLRIRRSVAAANAHLRGLGQAGEKGGAAAAGRLAQGSPERGGEKDATRLAAGAESHAPHRKTGTLGTAGEDQGDERAAPLGAAGQGTRVPGFVSAGVVGGTAQADAVGAGGGEESARRQAPEEPMGGENGEEIDLPDEEEEEEEEEEQRQTGRRRTATVEGSEEIELPEEDEEEEKNAGVGGEEERATKKPRTDA